MRTRSVKSGEIWRPVVGYESTHMVSDLGNIKLPAAHYTRWSPQSNKYISVPKKERILAQFPHFGSPYRAVRLSKKTVRVHQIVAKAFISNPECKPHVNHLNGIKDDNRAINLEWCTPSENHKHAFAIGLKHAQRGSNNVTAILNEEKVIQIRRMRKEGVGCTALGRIFGVKEQTIDSVIRGKSWRHVL